MRYKLINDRDERDFELIRGTELRAPVAKSALLLDEHITEKRPKYGTVRDKFDVYRWFREKVVEGFNELREALWTPVADDDGSLQPSAEEWKAYAKRKATNFFTRGYYVLLLLGELGDGE